VWIYTRTS